MTVSGALEGIRVLEVASYVTGPYVGMLLADLGADVIKTEEPRHGDPFRRWAGSGTSPTFASVNRNKRSLALDLRQDGGQHLFRRLAGQADLVIENFRPGTMEGWGLGYEALAPLNPRLIYCAITGFGETGPYCDRPGYDTIGQAMGGLLSLLTDLAAPQPMGISLSDHLTALYACYGLLGALFARQRTGRGQKVETSLLRATATFVGENAARYFATGEVPTRETRTHLAQVYAFTAGDGLPFVIHLSSPEKFWHGLTSAIGREDLRGDPRFAHREARQRHYDTLHTILAHTFQTGPRAQWLSRLQAHDVPCAPISTLEEVFSNPQVKSFGMPVELTRPDGESVRVVGSGVSLSETPPLLHTAPPRLGEHTQQILTDHGLTPEEIETLRVKEVIT